MTPLTDTERALLVAAIELELQTKLGRGTPGVLGGWIVDLLAQSDADRAATFTVLLNTYAGVTERNLTTLHDQLTTQTTTLMRHLDTLPVLKARLSGLVGV